jgi:hypothetical protein
MMTMIAVTKPALNIPPITEQLLKQSINKNSEGRENFFMADSFGL